MNNSRPDEGVLAEVVAGVCDLFRVKIATAKMYRVYAHLLEHNNLDAYPNLPEGEKEALTERFQESHTSARR